MKRPSVPALLACFLLFTRIIANGQDLSGSAQIDSSFLKDMVTYLSDDSLEGRGMGTTGSLMAGTMIIRQFEKQDMIPFYHRTFSQSFVKDTIIGRNIIGVVRARYYSEKYIVISAHYDHLGKLDGKIYNGADDNASGVAMLLTLSKYFSAIRAEGKGMPVNIIFAAFDGKEHNMTGSEIFIKKLPISKKDIVCNINLDQIGSTLAPPAKDSNYILVLGTKTNVGYKGAIEAARSRMQNPISINYDYYGSSTFAGIFYKTSDHYSFAKARIPALFFTSGIHMHTYKPTDDHYFINYPVLFNRTVLIRNLTEVIASSL
ncbi:MAG: M28 family peptidase [Rikenellaceae bacterium]|nr:M28 family peptidase [Rikenellaceae bacterium]